MNPTARRLLVVLTCLCLCLPSFPSAYNATPKLVVVVILDQFRGDYLDRYRDRFGAGGFRLLLERGAVFTNCNYDYANTRTAPGHATLFTGAYSNGHGIAANEWWDPPSNAVTDSVADRSAKVVTPAGPGSGGGASPHYLLATTLGDEMKLATGGKSRVFATALKDRAAILSAGFSGDAYWPDRRSGAFVTSTYYRNELPAWVKAFDSAGRAEKYWEREWKDASGKVLRTTSRRLPDGSPDPKARFYDIVGATPFGNDYQLEFARELIAQEKLGRGEATDLLIVSLSASDILGHEVGPDSPQMQEMVLALDRQMAGFFRYLDQELGLANLWIVLTADHGVSPVPRETTGKFRLPGATFKPEAIREAANKELAARFLKLRGPAVVELEWPFAFLSQGSFTATQVSQAEAERAAGEVLMRLTGWHGFYTRTQLAEGRVTADEMGRIYANSYSTYGGWYVLGVPAPFTMGYSPTDHSTGYIYDRHVPLAFVGTPFTPGSYRGHSEPVDLAVTLASLLGINAPTHAVGRVLTEALRDQRLPNPSGPPAGARSKGRPSR